MAAPVASESAYWANMVEWGPYNAAYLAALKVANPPYGQDPGLAAIYYDQQLCSMYVQDHIGGSSLSQWTQDCWENNVLYYIYDPAVNGAVSGFRNFTEGLVEDVLRNNSRKAASLAAINLILANGAYVNSGDVSDDLLSRECAYSLMTFINAARVGISLNGTQTARRDALLGYALGHIDQWCTSMTADYYRPFMGSITAHALIHYYTYVSADSRIIPALITLANYTWSSCWKATAGAWGQDSSFTYTDRTGFNSEDANVQPDLNMLIAPTWAWLWWKTGTQSWRTQGDQIVAGSISRYNGVFYDGYGAYLGSRDSSNPSGKQYNQQLVWGPKYFQWAVLDYGSSPTPPITPPTTTASFTLPAGTKGTFSVTKAGITFKV